MELLERRVETISGEFNSPEVASTLWAFATMGRKPGDRLMELLERRTEVIGGEFNWQEFEQLRLWFTITGRPPLVFLAVPPKRKRIF